MADLPWNTDTASGPAGTSEPMKRVRGLGLAAVGKVPPLKQFFMQEARGATGDLPQLLRGERP